MKKFLKVAGPYVVALAALVVAVAGLQYPAAPVEMETRALAGDWSNMTSLELSDDLIVGDDVTITGDTSIAGTLTLDGVAQSGPVAYGSATDVVSGTTIAHGIETTPTAALLTVGSTGGFTTTYPYVLAMDTVSITLGVADGITVPTVYWLAGK